MRREREWITIDTKCRVKGKRDRKKKKVEKKKRKIIVKAGERRERGFAGVDLLFRPAGVILVIQGRGE